MGHPARAYSLDPGGGLGYAALAMKILRITTLILTFVVLLLLAPRLAGNDSAASVAAGGIQLKREARIAMKSEKLFISRDKVRVQYEFLNETPQDITTEVAFPIPDYKFDLDTPTPAFDDFRLWVDDSEVKYQVEARALLNGKDLTALLTRYRVDVSSFGHYDFEKQAPKDLAQLPDAAVKELVQAGLFSADEEHYPLWTTHKTYYWTQTFHAGTVLHVRHEYTPVAGGQFLNADDFDDAARKIKIEEARKKLSASKDPESDKYEVEHATYVDKLLSFACIDPPLARTIAARVNARKSDPKAVQQFNVYVAGMWVDYILTTANSWKTPIGDFELTVEKPLPSAPGGKPLLVSFCWDGPVEKLDATHFVARAHDFVPKDELHVFFFDAF